MAQALRVVSRDPSVPRGGTQGDAHSGSPVFSARIWNERTLSMDKKPVTGNCYFFNYPKVIFFKARASC